MNPDRIAEIKKKAATVGGVANLKDGTKVYCESIWELQQFIKSHNYECAAYTEHVDK